MTWSTKFRKLRVTSEDYRDLFTMTGEYSIVHCMAADLDFIRDIVRVFDKSFEERKELMSHLSHGRSSSINKRSQHLLFSHQRTYGSAVHRPLRDVMQFETAIKVMMP